MSIGLISTNLFIMVNILVDFHSLLRTISYVLLKYVSKILALQENRSTSFKIFEIKTYYFYGRDLNQVPLVPNADTTLTID